MTSSCETLKDKDFQNWLKAAISIKIVKEGIERYVSSVIEKFHLESLQDILSVKEIDKTALCFSCTNEFLLKNDSKKCPKNICHRVKIKIINAHLYGHPSWKNTRVENWCKNHWEIAKCYMPPDGYIGVNSSSETDLNGILSVMMNHMEFVTDKVADKDDIRKKTREVTKEFRHSPDLTLNDKDLSDYIGVLLTFLESYKEKNEAGVKALEKLKKLKDGTLITSSDEITEALKDCIREEIQEEKRVALKDIEKEKNQSIQAIIDMVNQRLSAFEGKVKEILTNIEENIAVTIYRRDSSNKIPCLKTVYETQKQELYEDLMIFNKKLYSTIPLSPLFEKEDTIFEDIYVQPKMKIVEHPLRKSLRADIKTDITCLSDIFTRKLKNNIYVISKAGLGKTVFCKRLMIAWCRAHKREGNETGFEKEEDLQFMHSFDYAFLVLLRESRYTDCDIDKMIYHQVVKSLARSDRYTLGFLQDILTRERCLIILDGLDEWTHPKEKFCKTTNDIPHRKARDHCTILTTTRTWKFCSLSLSMNEIDQLVQIVGLDDRAADRLVDNAVSIFSDDETKKNGRDKKDFFQLIKKESINKLKSFPLILIHLICLWYKHHTIGDSYCEIFSNIVGLHVQRAQKRLGEEEVCGQKRRRISLPYCIAKNIGCTVSFELMKSLADLAFYSYFHTDRENSLVFDVIMAKKFLKDNYYLSMETGLLTQTKGLNLTEDNAPRVSFVHKRFQEYFAALHMFFDNDVKTVKNTCKNVEDILAMSDFFIYLNGMCPDVANMLFPAISQIITNSETVKGYRSDMGSWNYFVGYHETIKRLQTLFVNCGNEAIANKNKPAHVSFEDFIIDSDFRVESYSKILKHIIQQNENNVKSIKLRDLKTDTEFQNIVQLLRTSTTPALEKIDLKCMICDKSLELILHDSKKSLKCFIIKGGQWQDMKWLHKHIILSSQCLQMIWSMRQLEELYLRTIEFKHDQLEQLFSFVTGSSKMKGIGLGFFKCSEHNDNCKNLELDLANHSHLRMLEIGSLPLSKVKVNTESLEGCYVGNFKESSVLCDILDSLSQAPKLRVFCCGFLNREEDIERMLKTVANMKMLQRIWLMYMEFSDQEIRLCKEMKDIKELFLQNSEMTIGTFQELLHEVKTIGKNFIVGLIDCTVNPHEDFELEIQHMNSIREIRLIQDEKKENKRRDFIFKTLFERSMS